MTTTLATSLVLATMGAAPAAVPATVPTVESATERVLQSVAVTMGPDGTTTGVGSSVVRTDGSVEDAETSDATYSPTEVAGELPVRVLTSWRTSEGAGTDLADLQGYTGRVAIDVTVQNLTVRPDVLEYDAAGASRQQAALVGSPLTVTGSTSLGDLKAERVVTDDEGSGANVTNGVLGKGVDGTTVQWAALLAPPILSSSSEFSLVVDAKDFDVPTIDLSVQPGMVTDPSMGALVDAAFNPASSSELELQQRTIDLIGEVNLVLARASDTISGVRTSLTSSAETLGTQTVADLQASTQSVASNMSALDGALQSLRGDLSSTLETTGSSAISEMDQAVQTVDQMLGDTSAQPPTVQVRGDGCETTVADPNQAGSVYGSLLQVASQLDGYSEATTECKNAVEQKVLDTIGPKTEDECNDATAKSVTCTLFGAQERFAGIAEQLNKDTEEALKDLTPALYGDAVAEAEDVDAVVTQIGETTDIIADGRIGLVGALQSTARALRDGGMFEMEIDDLEKSIGAIYQDADALGIQLSEMKGQTDAAAQAICEVVGDGTNGTLTADKAEEIRSYLVATRCNETDETLRPPPSSGYRDSLSKRFDTRMAEIEEIKAASHVSVAEEGAALQLEETREQAAAVATSIETALAQTIENTQDLTLIRVLERLDKEFGELEREQGQLSTAVTKLNNEHSDAAAAVEAAVALATTNAGNAIGGAVKPEIDKVFEAGGNASEDLGDMLVNSSLGLSSSADAVVRNGRRAINGQKSDFLQAQNKASNNVADTIEDGLGQISSGVSSSTRDMEAATTLLTADLRKVLLDLGDRREGGGGLLGAMATNAATARTADYQLALAGDKATSYANVRSRDIDGLMLRQAQTEAAMLMLQEMPAFQLDLPSGSQHRTVYSFRIGDS